MRARIAKLHLSRRYFLCRHCNRLAYASQYEQPWERALGRVRKLRQRLCNVSEMAAPLPENAKHMRVRTYARLLEETLQAEILADEAHANHLRRLAAQIENKTVTAYLRTSQSSETRSLSPGSLVISTCGGRLVKCPIEDK